MTSATERLRALLDERDEYYQTSGNKTWWGRPIDRQTGKPINVFHCQAQPMGEDRLFVELQLATPEQAIDATLGRGTCEVECFDDGMDEGMDGEWFAYATATWHLSCGHEVYGSERPRYCSTCGKLVVEP